MKFFTRENQIKLDTLCAILLNLQLILYLYYIWSSICKIKYETFKYTKCAEHYHERTEVSIFWVVVMSELMSEHTFKKCTELFFSLKLVW